ncbi:hypothetical protein NDU88_005771 [Pleurodeles waltl]|uniref:Uncharacterized protein n=1 Tax=Pleurodeles waltl TaxID=8319 RepID=A0AAV7WCS2_PLEWA|nr:hypothetical protein NDU88_005771 [Pleurodeles waltl]
MDLKVQQALALLWEAGRLDLVAPEALAQGRPVRRASAGVGAAVVACSPPCAAGSGKVSAGRGRAGREAGPGAGMAGRGRVGFGGAVREAPRASLEAGLGQRARASGNTAQRSTAVRRYGARPGAALNKMAVPAKIGHGGKGKGGAEASRFSGGKKAAGRARVLSSAGGGEGCKGVAGSSGEQRDPLVPISKKWPTMLVWSSEDDEGALSG